MVSSSESLNIDWTDDDEEELKKESPPAANQDAAFHINWTSDDEREINAGKADSGKEIDWTTEDELEIEAACRVHQGNVVDCGSSTSSPALHGSKVDEFVSLGFPLNMIKKALKVCGSSDAETVVDTLLTYTEIENSPDDDFEVLDVLSSDEEQDGNVYETKEVSDLNEKKKSIVLQLVNMGYPADFASFAIDRCGVDTPIIDLIDMMAAAAMVQDSETSVAENLRGKEPAHETKERCSTSKQKRKLQEVKDMNIKRNRHVSDKGRSLERIHGNDQRLRIPRPMIGFALPNCHPTITKRRIPVEAAGRPYIYYENVASTPKGVWEMISNLLYGILPEFVDSRFFSAACRKRGYVHNLPLEGRFKILPIPPMTIHDALPHTKEHWPSWDPRTQLNCILSCSASAPMTERVKARVSKPGGPSEDDKAHVLGQCRKWNMVWVGVHKVAPLEPDEIEVILGYPRNHTRGGGVSLCDRRTALANSFQVDTVAYHLSVLKSMFPDGLNVLSLFSGIGGAEVALHRLGIRLKNVVSVEKSKTCRGILQDWWDATEQPGKLIHFNDVAQVTTDHLQAWVCEFSGFDLIIGGSPCNNLSGINRATRTGLDGKHSCLFYEYNRIVHTVRNLMRGRDH